MTADTPGPAVRRVRGVGAIIFDDAGRLLLVQRGHEPAKGQWSVPGGKVEPGETDAEAVVREVAEETGLTVRVGEFAGMVERAGSGGTVYQIFDYDASVVAAAGSGRGISDDVDAHAVSAAHAASDAADLRWVAPGELADLPLTEGLVEALREWGRLA